MLWHMYHKTKSIFPQLGIAIRTLFLRRETMIPALLYDPPTGKAFPSTNAEH